MTLPLTNELLDADAFVARLKIEGEKRYHDRHPFHIAMHAGKLSREQIQAWVRNRFYYQTRIPIKDAIVLSKSEDPAFRRVWIHRIVDHDGKQEGEGGIAQWLRLAHGVGLDVEEVKSLRGVLPGVRFACDAYVTLVRERPLVEAVASSLTEFFSPDIMARRIVSVGDALSVGRGGDARVLPRARDAGERGLARGHRLRARECSDASRAGALHRRAHHEDADPVGAARCAEHRPPPDGAVSREAMAMPIAIEAAFVPRLAKKARLKHDRHANKLMILYPERGLELNDAAAEIAQKVRRNAVDRGHRGRAREGARGRRCPARGHRSGRARLRDDVARQRSPGARMTERSHRRRRRRGRTRSSPS